MRAFKIFMLVQFLIFHSTLMPCGKWEVLCHEQETEGDRKTLSE
jgi:hypothetical protein